MKPHLFTRATVGASAYVAVLLPLTGCSSENSGKQSPSAAPSTLPTSPPTTASAPPDEYRDGTYTARGVYGGAPSYMDFTLTLEAGVITDVASELMPDNNDTSRGFQERFAAAVPEEVIGKSIDDLEVGIIAGASGCADGFNDALDKIREQAVEAR